MSWELDELLQAKVNGDGLSGSMTIGGKKSAITGERKDAVLKIKTHVPVPTNHQDFKNPEVRIVKNTPFQRSNSSFKEIQVHAADDKTGIDRYSARINGSFARINFDYKKELLKVIIPKELVAGNHNLRIVVIDGVGNTTVKEYSITL